MIKDSCFSRQFRKWSSFQGPKIHTVNISRQTRFSKTSIATRWGANILEVKARQSNFHSTALFFQPFREGKSLPKVRWEVCEGIGFLIIPFHTTLLKMLYQKLSRFETIITRTTLEETKPKQKHNPRPRSSQPLCTTPEADALQCCLHTGVLRWSKFKCLWHTEIAYVLSQA